MLFKGDKKPELPNFETVQEFFEEYIQYQPEKHGVVYMLPSVFSQMANACKTEEDLVFMNSALNDFIGHKNLLESHHIEPLFEKALEMKQPQAVLNILDHHREYMYFPSPQIIKEMCDYYTKTEDLDYELCLKAFFSVLSKKLFIEKPKEFYSGLIQRAFKENDRETVLNAYIDIYDYQQTDLSASDLGKVLLSFNYDKQVDHFLRNHIHEQLKNRNLENSDCQELRFGLAVFATQVGGYLEALDLLEPFKSQQISFQDEKVKEFLFDKLADEGIDSEIRKEILERVTELSFADEAAEFYGIQENFPVQAEEPEQPEQQEATEEQAEENQTEEQKEEPAVEEASSENSQTAEK